MRWMLYCRYVFTLISGGSLSLYVQNDHYDNVAILHGGFVSYSLLCLQSVDFTIFLLELLLKLSNPSTHIRL